MSFSLQRWPHWNQSYIQKVAWWQENPKKTPTRTYSIPKTHTETCPQSAPSLPSSSKQQDNLEKGIKYQDTSDRYGYFIQMKLLKKNQQKKQPYLMQCYILDAWSDNRKSPLEQISKKQMWIPIPKSWLPDSGMRNLLLQHKSNLIKTMKVMDINFYNTFITLWLNSKLFYQVNLNDLDYFPHEVTHLEIIQVVIAMECNPLGT